MPDIRAAPPCATSLMNDVLTAAFIHTVALVLSAIVGQIEYQCYH